MATQESPEDLNQLWESALAEYAKDTTGKDKDAINLDALLSPGKSLTSLDELLEQIEASGQSFKDFRSKRGKLWVTLKLFVSPLAAVLKIAITPSSVGEFGIPVSAVLGACLHLVLSCERVSEAFDWIEQVFHDMREFSERLEVYARRKIDPLLKKQVVGILALWVQVITVTVYAVVNADASILKLIGRSEYLIRKGYFREYLRVAFLGKDEKTKKLVEEVNKLFGSEQRLVVAITGDTASRIEEKVEGNTRKIEEIGESMTKVLGTLKETEEKETSAEIEDRLRRIFCNTSAPEDVEDTYVRNRGTLLHGTGAWLKDEDLFRAWIEHTATILWIFGGPGAGKSYLSTWIIKQLRQEDIPKEQRKAAYVAYFFVKENNEALRDANNILKTLAWQLIWQDPHFKQHAGEVCKQRALTITAKDTWENLFLGYYCREDGHTDAPFTSIVIDGLDEATAATQLMLLQFLAGLASVSKSFRPRIQFAVVGRTTLQEDAQITQEKIYYIQVTKLKNQDDIDSYIRKRLEDVEVLKVMRERGPTGLDGANKMGARIRKRVLNGADGVFLWAKLLLDTIVRKDVPQIERILKEPPGNLDDMIASVFERLAKDEEIDHAVLRKMLVLTAYAQRPLKFGELNLFLSLPNRKPLFLLWKQTRGKLSSVFQLKFPKNFDPDEKTSRSEGEMGDEGAEPNDEDSAQGAKEKTDSGHEGLGAFDFSGGRDDDDTENTSDDDDIFYTIADHSLQSQINNGEDGDEFIGELSDEQLQTESVKDYLNAIMHHLSDPQLQTEVAFSHARIKDYLVGAARPGTRRMPDCIAVPQEQRAHVEIAMICLDVMRLEISLQNEHKYLVDYPARYLMLHLEKINSECVSDEDFGRIVNGLYWLFGTETGAKCLINASQEYDEFHSSRDAFFQMWTATDQYLRMVQRWFGEVEKRGTGHLEDVGSTPSTWAKTAAGSLKDLLKPAMMASSRIWLTKPGFSRSDYADKDEFALWILHGWSCLVETGTVASIQPWNFWALSPERLENLANWAGLEHDVHWHTCLGWAMMDGGFYLEAISQYNEALAQYPQAWVAIEGLARCHGGLSEYQLAIDVMKKAVEAIPESSKSISSYLYTRIMTWGSQIGDDELAYEAAMKGIDADSSNLDAQLRFFEALHARGESERIVRTIQWLNGLTSVNQDYTWLVRFLISGRDAFAEMGKACREEGQPAEIVEAMEEALRQIDLVGHRWTKVWLPLQVAEFRYKFYGQEAEFIKSAETFLERLRRETPKFRADYNDFEIHRKRITNKLAQLYFDFAVAAWDDGKEVAKASVFAHKLKILAVSVPTSFADSYEGFDFFRPDYPALLWGRWQRDYKHAVERIWRKCFRVRLLEEMNSLDDDDPTNDVSGMGSLAISLFHAGDRKDAAAILAILYKPLEHLIAKKVGGEEGPEEGKVLEKGKGETGVKDPQAQSEALSVKQAGRGLPLDIKDSWGYLCNNCRRDASEAAEMYFCEVCHDFNWCGECLVKVRDPNITPGLREHWCNPNHDFYRAWPIPDEARDLAAEYLDGAIELRREWLERLRGEWLSAGV